MEDKKKKYEQALHIANMWYKNTAVPHNVKTIFEQMFPELKESEDEKIRRDLIEWIEKQYDKPNGRTAAEAAKEETFDNQNCIKFTNYLESCKSDSVISDNKSVTKLSNGVYIIYKNGTYCKFSRDCKKDDACSVGIVQNGSSFAVNLKEYGRFRLFTSLVKCPTDCDFYVRKECDALNDWDCVARTKHIQEIGTDIFFERSDEYIPSLPMLSAIIYWSERGLNEALKFLGGETISSSYYWSSTEYDKFSAWSINKNSGYVLYNNNKECCLAVRTVYSWDI